MVNVFVLALLTVGNNVLLLCRQNVSFGSGMYSMAGGKVEQGETARQAIQREVLEETGLNIPVEQFALVHVLHRKGTDTEFIALCFAVDIADLPAPYNNEPDKCSDMRFFPLDQLPSNILPAHVQIIQCIEQGLNYSEHGW
jgi:8-oxo-dGTP diphosphatase